MKVIRIFFSTIALIIVVAALALSSLYLLINPNKLKSTIITEVKQKTGYQMAIEGNLTWSFYPRFSIHLKQVNLSYPNQSQPFLNLNDVFITTPLSQILAKKDWRAKIYVAYANLLNLKANNVNAEVNWIKHQLNLMQIRADLYKGILAGNIEGKNFNTTPEWHFDLKMNNIQVKPFFIDMQGEDSKLKLSGVAQIKLQLTTSGNSQNDWTRNLTGISEFNISNGFIEGIDLNYLVQTADALINKQPVTLPTAFNQTAFNSFYGVVQFQNGSADIDKLQLLTPAFVTNGAGNIILFSQVINMKLHLSSKQALKNQWDIPILITGKLQKPDVQIDLNEWQRIEAQQAFNDLKTKAREQVQKHVHGKVGELLQNLLGK